ncbi:hypothetical protein BCR35DRAFT_285925 [Leucosporidium creatinivorum]|uniref:Ribosomal protein L22/L17 n=1 Tax=Leucosporidium creatinivorum TaxID=106004 RepID=A0A1Y2G692_9BASI|nr:hypothetical protein BCR35DRAFT_285925 [Leucosporidium creatinivorum]
MRAGEGWELRGGIDGVYGHAERAVGGSAVNLPAGGGAARMLARRCEATEAVGSSMASFIRCISLMGIALCRCSRGRCCPFASAATRRFGRFRDSPLTVHPLLQARYAHSELIKDRKAVGISKGTYLRVHYKNTRETAAALHNLELSQAITYLEDVQAHRQCIPFRRHNGAVGRTAQAKKHGVVQGRWPVKSAKFLLGLLKNAQANAEVNGLDVNELTGMFLCAGSELWIRELTLAFFSHSLHFLLLSIYSHHPPRYRTPHSPTYASLPALSFPFLPLGAPSPFPLPRLSPLLPSTSSSPLFTTITVSRLSVQQAPKTHRRTYRAHGRMNPYKGHPCHIEVILAPLGVEIPKAEELPVEEEQAAIEA